MGGKDFMTLDEALEKLQEIRKDLGRGDIKVYFDTEASTFNCHIVPLYNVSYVKQIADLDDEYIIFTTRYHYN